MVIEVKYQNNPKNDLDKITDHWFKPPLNYNFGVTIQIDYLDVYYINILKNEDQISKREN